jgi:hypothetical protein
LLCKKENKIFKSKQHKQISLLRSEEEGKRKGGSASREARLQRGRNCGFSTGHYTPWTTFCVSRIGGEGRRRVVDHKLLVLVLYIKLGFEGGRGAEREVDPIGYIENFLKSGYHNLLATNF